MSVNRVVECALLPFILFIALCGSALGTVSITTTSVPTAVTGVPYTTTIMATGGTLPYTWSVSAGSLPTGLSLNAATGTISGTPTTVVLVSATIKVTDSSSPQQSNLKSFPFHVVAPLSITTTSLPSGTVGKAYSTTLKATGGTLPYSWTVSSGTLPPGLSLNATSGILSGNPTTSGTFTPTIQVTDTSSPKLTASKPFTITIQGGTALTITTTSLPGGKVGTAYSSTVKASGGVLPYTWSIISGTLPTGLSLGATTGTISGTPSASGSFSFTVQVADSSAPQMKASQAFTVVIQSNGLTILTTSLPAGSKGAPYSATLTATGGTLPYHWSIISGSLPTGLTLGASTGTISGTPTVVASFTFTVQVTDSSTTKLKASAPFTVPIFGLVISTTSLPNATQGAFYATTVLASGGTLPYTWSIISGSLPPGLALTASNGLIAGTPTASGAFTFTIQVADSSTPQQTATQVLTLTVVPSGLAITSGAPNVGTIGALYNFVFVATGGTPPYSWSISSGSLPAGITLNAATGILAGIATTQQTANFTVKVSDSGSQTATQTDSITIFTPVPPPTVSLLSIQVQPPAPTLTVGGSQQLTATGIFSDGTTQDFTSSAIWVSSAPTIVSVSSTGLATGVASGTASITATANLATGYNLLSVGPTPTGSANYYVATNGKDTWSGTLPAPNGGNTDGPFATLDRARMAVQGKPGSVVQIENGTYFLPAAVQFGTADSGTASAPIVYENYPGASPIISGGIKITGWTNTVGSAWKANVNKTLYPNVTNFESLFYMPAGATDATRRYRPRLAATGVNCTIAGYLCNAASNPVVVSSQSTNCGVQVSNGWECFDQFFFNGGDLAAAGYHGMGLGDVQVLDFELWTMSRMRLASVDGANNIAHLTGPTQEIPQSNGFLPNHRYLVENVLESLNKNGSGQWYLDRCQGCPNTTTTPASNWTLTYVAQTGENPTLDTVIVPQQTQLLVGTSASNIIFRGLTFSHDNWIPGTAGLGDQQGMPAVTAAVSFLNSQNVTFDSCIFSHIQGWAVEFAHSGSTATSGSNQVINSEIYDVGAGGIRIGRTPGASGGLDTDANVPQYNLIQNNSIVAGGRLQPTGIGTGIWVGNAHHNMIVHNEVSDFYSGAVGIGTTFGILNGSGFAHDNIAAFNHLYTLGQGVTSDMGGIYFATSATTGNMSLNNVVHDVTHNYQDADGYGGNGIYFDQGSSNVIARDNLVYRISSSGAFNNLSDHGSDTFAQKNLFSNNIFALTGELTDRGGFNPNSFSYTTNIGYFDKGSVQSGNWSCVDVLGIVDCPLWFFFDSNDYWDTTGRALSFQTTNPVATYTLSQWQPLGEEVHSINQDPLFTNPNDITQPPADGFTLQPSSPALTILHFSNFDPTQAGRSNPILIPPTLTCGGVATVGACPAFPLQLLDPLTGY